MYACSHPYVTNYWPGARWTCPQCGTKYVLTKPKKQRWWRAWSAPDGYWRRTWR